MGQRRHTPGSIQEKVYRIEGIFTMGEGAGRCVGEHPVPGCYKMSRHCVAKEHFAVIFVHGFTPKRFLFYSPQILRYSLIFRANSLFIKFLSFGSY
jgi:hypothetical protein